MLSAIRGTEYAALRTRTERMAQHRRVQPVWISWVHGEIGNLLRVIERQVRPGDAAVRRTINAVADRQIRPMQAFAACHVDGSGIGRSNRDRANGLSGCRVEQGIPGPAVISGFPYAAIDRADQEGVGLARNAGHRSRAPAAERSNHPPMQRLRGVDRCFFGNGHLAQQPAAQARQQPPVGSLHGRGIASIAAVIWDRHIMNCSRR